MGIHGGLFSMTTCSRPACWGPDEAGAPAVGDLLGSHHRRPILSFVEDTTAGIPTAHGRPAMCTAMICWSEFPGYPTTIVPTILRNALQRIGFAAQFPRPVL